MLLWILHLRLAPGSWVYLGVAWVFPGLTSCSCSVSTARFPQQGFQRKNCQEMFPPQSFRSKVSMASCPQQGSRQQGFHSTAATLWFSQQCFHSKFAKAVLPARIPQHFPTAGFPHHGFHSIGFIARFPQQGLQCKVSIAPIHRLYIYIYIYRIQMRSQTGVF